MNDETSHPTQRMLDRYAAGETGGGADVWWSVEAHLEACPACADRLGEVVGRVSPATAALLDRVWGGLTAATALGPGPRESRGPAVVRRLRWFRRWAPPALLPRLGMTVLVVLAAVGLDLVDGAAPGRFPSLVLLLAPVAPLLGVAAAWHRGSDPAHELVVVCARAGLELVLRRTVVVLVVVIPVLGGAGWVADASPAVWLLPCLAFTVGALALGEVVGLHRAATGLAVAWTVLVVGPSLAAGRPSVVLAAAGVPAWAAVTAAVTVVLLVRRRAYTAPVSTR